MRRRKKISAILYELLFFLLAPNHAHASAITRPRPIPWPRAEVVATRWWLAIALGTRPG